LYGKGKGVPVYNETLQHKGTWAKGGEAPHNLKCKIGSGQHHFTPEEPPQYSLARPQRMPGHFQEEDTFLIPAGN